MNAGQGLEEAAKEKRKKKTQFAHHKASSYFRWLAVPPHTVSDAGLVAIGCLENRNFCDFLPKKIDQTGTRKRRNKIKENTKKFYKR